MNRKPTSPPFSTWQFYSAGIKQNIYRHQIKPDKKSLAEECLDDLPAVAKLHAVLSDPKSTPEEARHALGFAVGELQENYVKFCDDRGIEP